MAITISPQAKQYLEKKGKSAIRFEAQEHRMGGCAMGIAEPSIHLGEPRNAATFVVDEVDGIKVYTSFYLKPKKDGVIEVDLQKVLGFQSLVVSGFDILG